MVNFYAHWQHIDTNSLRDLLLSRWIYIVFLTHSTDFGMQNNFSFSPSCASFAGTHVPGDSPELYLICSYNALENTYSSRVWKYVHYSQCFSEQMQLWLPCHDISPFPYFLVSLFLVRIEIQRQHFPHSSMVISILALHTGEESASLSISVLTIWYI